MGTAPDAVKRLVDRSDQNRKVFLSGDYREERLRPAFPNGPSLTIRHSDFGVWTFLDPFFSALGWDMDNTLDTIRARNWGSVPFSPGLLESGREFARLHLIQRKTVLERDIDNYMEFANKAIHPSVAAGWAFAAGVFQNNAKALEAHYRLADSASPPEDPLNAAALLQARLKGVDKDTYRGLGSRISGNELGRVLEVFELQATVAKRPGITPKLANAAIKSYEAKRQRRAADKAVEGI